MTLPSPFTMRLLATLAILAATLSAQNDFRPFAAKYCLTCHNAKLKTANLNLEGTPTPETWDKIVDRLVGRKMPPPGQPAPTEAEIRAVTAGIIRKSDPGRVTARRLNRVEYDNTIRDLLGVPYRPAAGFPTDDSGYGFDNIGDVLSLSPMLMEKYLAAARKISRLALGIHDDLPAKPTVLVRYMAKRSHDARGSLAASNILPYSMRGALYTTHLFPVDAEYELRFRVVNYRIVELSSGPNGRVRRQMSEAEARKAFPPVKVILTVDGKPIAQDIVEGLDTVDYQRGEVVGRLRLKAGEHRLRVSLPELADLEDPRKNIRPDLRRYLFVDYLDIAGPFNPSPEPPESYKRIFICGHAKNAHQPDCARKIVANLARRAYRRPVSAQEVDALAGFVAMAQKAGDTFDDGVRLALQTILVSPHFLFRIERDASPNDPAVAHPVSDYELASRLSYFLWSSMPDEKLLAAAEAGKLPQPEILASEVKRMLADPKSGAMVDNFAAQWLQLRALDRARPDPDRFPTVDDELVDAMRRETNLFLDAIIREDRSILDLLDAPFTFLNGPLARHYGIQGVVGEEFRRIDLQGTARAGLLTHASILALSSYPTRTSPVLRGKWVLENILGAPPPPPPPDVPDLDESKIGATASLRQQLEAHRAKPACAVCHTQMDAIGFGFEGFDAAGARRTHDGKFPIDDSGTLPGGKTFRGPRELVDILKLQGDAFARCLAEKMLTFALGRGLEPYDRPAVEQIARRVKQDNYRFSTLVTEIVRSTPFRMRRGDGGKS